MTNHEIADHFELLSKLMDIHGDDSFRARSYASAAFRIEKVPEQLSTLSVEEMKAIPAIGANMAKKIAELNITGKLAVLEDHLSKTPKGVVDMLSIKGIGPKKIALLWRELDIESIGELEYACQENRLVTIKGFGAKTQASILESIRFIKANSGFCLYAEADALVANILQFFEANYPGGLYSPAGAFRLQRNVLDSIDWVCTLEQSQVLSAFADITFEATERDDILSIKLEGSPVLNFYLAKSAPAYYKQLFQRSTSADFLQAFENAYRYPENITTEHDIFTSNGLPFIAPALRERPEILRLAAENRLPGIIQPSDIKGIIHCHSTYSDGQHGLEQMAKAAKEKGYEYLVISDHSQAAFYANGLTPERIIQQHIEIEKLNQKLAPFKIFKSIEADILNDGRLDHEDTVLSSFDLVIASVHSNLKMSEEKAMQRLLTAIQHPATRILGHPTGRLLLSRAGYPVDHKTLIDACAVHDVAIEINAHPRRLDLDWTWIEYALSKNVLLSIDPDAHSIDGMDLVKYGVFSAQKGGLTKERNLSSFDLAQMEAFVNKKKW